MADGFSARRVEAIGLKDVDKEYVVAVPLAKFQTLDVIQTSKILRLQIASTRIRTKGKSFSPGGWIAKAVDTCCSSHRSRHHLLPLRHIRLHDCPLTL